MFKWSGSNTYKLANDYVISFQLFKSLQGMSQMAKLHYLRMASENIGHLRSVIEEIQILKKKRALEAMFAQQVRCSIEEAGKKYPTYFKQLDNFIGKT